MFQFVLLQYRTHAPPLADQVRRTAASKLKAARVQRVCGLLVCGVYDRLCLCPC